MSTAGRTGAFGAVHVVLPVLTVHRRQCAPEHGQNEPFTWPGDRVGIAVRATSGASPSADLPAAIDVVRPKGFEPLS